MWEVIFALILPLLGDPDRMNLLFYFGLIPMTIGEHLLPEVFSETPLLHQLGPRPRPVCLSLSRRLAPSRGNPAPILFPAAPVTTVSIGLTPVECAAIRRW